MAKRSKSIQRALASEAEAASIVEQARRRAAIAAAQRIEEAGETAITALLEVARQGEGEAGTGRAGAARALLDFAGLIGQRAAQSLTLGARQGDDGKLEIVVRYEQAKPPDPDDAAG